MGLQGDRTGALGHLRRRLLKKSDNSWLHKYDLSKLKHLFLAGEPLDQPTHEWIMGELKLPVIDNYWQTETGWPILSTVRGIEDTKIKFGTPSFPVLISTPT